VLCVVVDVWRLLEMVQAMSGTVVIDTGLRYAIESDMAFIMVEGGTHAYFFFQHSFNAKDIEKLLTIQLSGFLYSQNQ